MILTAIINRKKRETLTVPAKITGGAERNMNYPQAAAWG